MCLSMGKYLLYSSYSYIFRGQQAGLIHKCITTSPTQTKDQISVYYVELPKWMATLIYKDKHNSNLKRKSKRKSLWQELLKHAYRIITAILNRQISLEKRAGLASWPSGPAWELTEDGLHAFLSLYFHSLGAGPYILSCPSGEQEGAKKQPHSFGLFHLLQSKFTIF